MTDLLLFDESWPRIANVLHRYDDLRVVCWHLDGQLTIDGHTVTADSIAPEIGWISFDVLARGQTKCYVDTLMKFDSVRWVQTGHAGLDDPLYGALAARGVRLSKSYAQSVSIAEYTLAHALHYFQNIESRLAAQRAGEWKHLRFRELCGTRWLVIGFGHIGRRVAERARAFNCYVTTLRRSGAPHPAADVIVGRDELTGALAQSDVVVLACPETPETTGLVDQAFIAAMKKGSLLINVARGGLVNDEALLGGLARGQPESAVLDAFAVEPLPADHPYWEHPNVVITAHMSNAGNGTVDRGSEQFLENLHRYLHDDTPGDEVDPASLPGMV